MKLVIARPPVKEGKEAEFEEVALELRNKTREREPGVVFYEFCKSSEGEYFFVEVYQDEEALRAHGDTPHLEEIAPKLYALMDGKPKFTFSDVI